MWSTPSAALFQNNPNTVTLNDALACLTFFQNPGVTLTAEQIAASISSISGQTVTAGSLNPVPTPDLCNFIQDGNQGVGLADVMAVLVAFQNPGVTLTEQQLAAGVNGILATAYTAADVLGIPPNGETPVTGTLAGRVADATGAGIANWTVYLDANGDGFLGTGEVSVQTDGQGNYQFSNLAPGRYRVANVIQTEFEQTAPLGFTPTDPRSGRQGERIVGGQPAPDGAYPAMVSLQAQRPDGSFFPFCGGTLIAPTWVLTAAHCLVLDNGVVPPDVVLIGTNTLNSGGTRINVTEAIVFPQYRVGTAGELTEDVALLKLEQPASQPPTTLITQAQQPTLTTPGTPAVATGWGNTTEGGTAPNALQEVTIPLISDAQCQQNYQGIYSLVGEAMICAGVPQGGIDACQGDSGGPLFVDTTSGKVQVGITSFGVGCARPNRPGVYTEVATYTNWISGRIGQGSYEVDLAAGESLNTLDFAMRPAENFVFQVPGFPTSPLSGSLGFPGQVNGQLQAGDLVGLRGDYIDLYEIIGNPAQNFEAIVTSTQFDTFLYLINRTTGAVIRANDDASQGDFDNSVLALTPNEIANTLLAVGSYNRQTTGSYTLRLAPVGTYQPLTQASAQPARAKRSRF
ncbi:MAG: hypothetical protein OHK0012_02660 [Synechococcales cyanobacterium]